MRPPLAWLRPRLFAAFAVLLLLAGRAWPGCASDYTYITIYDRLSTPQDLDRLDAPEREAWQQPERVLDALNIKPTDVLADVGAGSGYFTVRLAHRVPKGRVYAVDVMKEALERVEQRVAAEQLGNVRVVWNTKAPGAPAPSDELNTYLPPRSCDLVLLVNTLHESFFPANMLFNLKSKLKDSGRIVVIDWRQTGVRTSGGEKDYIKWMDERFGPGPRNQFRLAETELSKRARIAGLELVREETFLQFQYFHIYKAKKPEPDAGE